MSVKSVSSQKWLRLPIRPLLVIVLLSLSLSGCGVDATQGEVTLTSVAAATIRVEAISSNQSSLSGLLLTGADLDQPFQADRLTYTASVDAARVPAASAAAGCDRFFRGNLVG
jgi:hypothetical protein